MTCMLVLMEVKVTVFLISFRAAAFCTIGHEVCLFSAFCIQLFGGDELNFDILMAY